MDFLKSSVEILCLGTDDSPKAVRAVLEDAESPTTRKTVETLYQSVIDKGHIDFGDIPKSKGKITNYSGYKTMMETLSVMETLASSDKTYAAILKYVKTVTSAINYITGNASFYEQGFTRKNKMVMLEYNSFTYTCVEATTSLLYQFTEFMRTPSSQEITTTLRNTKYRADLFYINQLEEYNAINRSGQYQKYLSAMIKSGQENFVMDSFAVGSIAIITTVMLSIIPVTRRIIYSVQDVRGKLAEDLELQAYFLELNAARVKSQESVRGKEKTANILKKQEEVRLKFLRLADKLRVKSLKNEELSVKRIEQEDRTISLDSMRNAVDTDDFAIV
jgi:hypothetical protein